MQSEHRVSGIGDVGRAERHEMASVRVDLASQVPGADERRLRWRGSRRRGRGRRYGDEPERNHDARSKCEKSSGKHLIPF
jgi:hypothetical protein